MYIRYNQLTALIVADKTFISKLVVELILLSSRADLFSFGDGATKLFKRKKRENQKVLRYAAYAFLTGIMKVKGWADIHVNV